MGFVFMLNLYFYTTVTVLKVILKDLNSALCISLFVFHRSSVKVIINKNLHHCGVSLLGVKRSEDCVGFTKLKIHDAELGGGGGHESKPLFERNV